MTIIETILDNMQSDDCDQSDRLRTLYESATQEQKQAIDDALICICGYSMRTIISQVD